MTVTGAALSAGSEPSQAKGVGSVPQGRWGRVAGSPGWVAAGAWLVCTPVAWLIPSLVGANPWTMRGGVLPLAVGGAVAFAVGVLAWWSRGRWMPALAGAAAGMFAAYVVLVLRTALHGTPYPFEGPYGDTARFMASVTRYTRAWVSRDGIVGSVPSEYPPLFPWVAGKIAWLLGIPGWKAVQPAEILGASLSVLVAFWMWLRVTAAPAALGISVLVLTVFGAPNKVYEALAMAVVVPWILLTLARPERGRLHWAVAGVIGAALVLTYYAYLAFAAIGVAVLIWSVWRSEPERSAYLRYLGKVAGVILVLSSWWWVPYGWAMLHGGQQVADMFQAAQIPSNPFPFLDTSPLGLMELLGLGALLLFWRRSWWAGPLLLILFGAYGYRVLGMLRWVLSAHSSLFYYTTELISTVLLAGLVLAVAESGPPARRLAAWLQGALPASARGRGSVGVPVLTVLLAFAGYTYWSTWMPANGWQADLRGGAMPNDPQTFQSGLARQAHEVALPNGSHTHYGRFAPRQIGLLDIRTTQSTVEKVRGRNAVPSTLSDSDSLFAFLPYNGYMDTDRNASLAPVQWDERFADLMRLTRTTDPAAFADASAHTRFGAIDVFILYDDGAKGLRWRPWRVPTTPTFQRSQFDPSRFVIKDLPGREFLAVRIPQ